MYKADLAPTKAKHSSGYSSFDKLDTGHPSNKIGLPEYSTKLQLTCHDSSKLIIPGIVKSAMPPAQTISCLQAKARKDKEAGVKKTKAEKKGHRAKGKAFYKGLTSDSDYVGEDYEVFSSWLGQSQ